MAAEVGRSSVRGRNSGSAPRKGGGGPSSAELKMHPRNSRKCIHGDDNNGECWPDFSTSLRRTWLSSRGAIVERPTGNKHKTADFVVDVRRPRSNVSYGTCVNFRQEATSRLFSPGTFRNGGGEGGRGTLLSKRARLLYRATSRQLASGTRRGIN